MRDTRSRLAALACAPVLLALVTGCGGSDPAPSSADTTPGASGAAATSPAAEGSPAPSGSPSRSGEPPVEDAVPGAASAPTSTGDVDVTAEPTGGAAVLRAIRVGRHPGFDRVVWEFDRPFGGYHVGYVDEVREDGSGEEVPLRGSAFLVLSVQGATLDNVFQVDDGTRRRRYQGQQWLSPDLAVVEQIGPAGDFEAVLGYALGLDGRHAFRVTRLSGPARLVVDVASS